MPAFETHVEARISRERVSRNFSSITCLNVLKTVVNTKQLFFYWAAAARGSSSLRRADAAQVCSDVGLVAFDGEFECSFASKSAATAARQIVSERW